MGIDLSGRKAAVLGGDERETETLRLLQSHGAAVDSFGCPPSAEQALGRPQASSVRAALNGANIVICPIPYPAEDGSLYAPHAPEKVYVTADALDALSENAVLITGVATPAMREAAEARRLSLREYEHDDDLMILRAAAIAEGAVCKAIEHSRVTIHQSPVLVAGFGRTATALTRLLIGMRARVSVAARSPVARAQAYEMGVDAYPFDQLETLVQQAAIIFNTVPARVFTREVLRCISSETVLIDMSAPPGGLDREAAAELGLNFVWARGLGGIAPRTVAKSQWIGIERILQAEISGT